MTRPLAFRWTGKAMQPHILRLAERAFTVGESYLLVEHQERSATSHNHYFAAVHEAWKNLPENLAGRFPTSDHLRKRALVDAGYCDEEVIDCHSKEVAATVAATIRKHDDFAVIFIRGDLVIVRTAKSQKASAMDKKTFQESKQAVLDIVAEMIGVDPKTLSAEAGKAA